MLKHIAVCVFALVVGVGLAAPSALANNPPIVLSNAPYNPGIANYPLDINLTRFELLPALENIDGLHPEIFRGGYSVHSELDLYARGRLLTFRFKGTVAAFWTAFNHYLKNNDICTSVDFGGGVSFYQCPDVEDDKTAPPFGAPIENRPVRTLEDQ